MRLPCAQDDVDGFAGYKPAAAGSLLAKQTNKCKHAPQADLQTHKGAREEEEKRRGEEREVRPKLNLYKCIIHL